LGQVIVTEFLHGGLDIMQRTVEFLAHREPVLHIRFFRDALAAFEHGFFDIDRFGEGQHPAADVFDLLGILGLHSDESLCNHGAKEESDLRPVAALPPQRVPQFRAPVGIPQLVEHDKNLVGTGTTTSSIDWAGNEDKSTASGGFCA
jgi:hypothetical protein